jgi:hypothetical protein
MYSIQNQVNNSSVVKAENQKVTPLVNFATKGTKEIPNIANTYKVVNQSKNPQASIVSKSLMSENSV